MIAPDEVIAWIERHVSIQNASGAAKGMPVIPFTLKPGQRRFCREMKAMRLEEAWSVACKSRQVGLTTLMLAWCCALCCLLPGFTVAFVAPEDVIASAIRRKWSIIWRSVMESLGSAWVGVAENNEHCFGFGNGSRVLWVSACKTRDKAAEAVVGDTVNLVVLSELALYPFAAETIAALAPTLNHAGCNVVVDSTPPQQPGRGETYLEIAKLALSGHPGYEFFFWPWWFEPAYRAATPALDLTDEERTLAKRHGLDLFQLAWRRAKMASPSEGPTFHQTYPETAQGALSPRREGYAFDDAVVTKWMGVPLEEYPAPLAPGEVAALLPTHGPGDLFLSAKWGAAKVGEGYVRIWRPPVEGAKYYGGVDPSDGLKHGDWQTCVVIDQWGNHCATVRTRLPVQRFAALCQRMGELYRCWLEVEMSAHGGPSCVWWLQQSMSEADAQRQRCQGLEKVFVRILQRAVSATNSSNRINAYMGRVNGGFEFQDPDMFNECLGIDPSTGRCRRKRVDHDDYLDGFGIAEDRRAQDAAKAAAALPVKVSVARRKLAANDLARR
jgi:hypothetical protein